MCIRPTTSCCCRNVAGTGHHCRGCGRNRPLVTRLDTRGPADVGATGDHQVDASSQPVFKLHATSNWRTVAGDPMPGMCVVSRGVRQNPRRTLFPEVRTWPTLAVVRSMRVPCTREGRATIGTRRVNFASSCGRRPRFNIWTPSYRRFPVRHSATMLMGSQGRHPAS
jgi:hypothetical protein